MGDAVHGLGAAPPAEHEGEPLAPVAPSALPDVLTVEQVAALLRLNRKTVYEMVQRGEIPGVRTCGRAIRAHRDTVIRWLADGQGRSARRKKSR